MVKWGGYAMRLLENACVPLRRWRKWTKKPAQRPSFLFQSSPAIVLVWLSKELLQEQWLVEGRQQMVLPDPD